MKIISGDRRSGKTIKLLKIALEIAKVKPVLFMSFSTPAAKHALTMLVDMIDIYTYELNRTESVLKIHGLEPIIFKSYSVHYNYTGYVKILDNADHILHADIISVNTYRDEVDDFYCKYAPDCIKKL